MAERITVTLRTGNAAFDDHPATEVARILRHAADLIEQGREGEHLRDRNGNTVGSITIKPIDHDKE